MTAGVGPVSGTKLYIGTSESTPSPDDWIEIGDISNLGDISQQYAQIAVESLGSGDTYQVKGQRSFPNLDVMMNRNDSDMGQLALKAAADASRGTLYNFRIVETDGGTAVWKGEVFGYGPSYGGVAALRTVKTSISLRPSTVVITPSV